MTPNLGVAHKLARTVRESRDARKIVVMGHGNVQAVFHANLVATPVNVPVDFAEIVFEP